MPEEIIDIYNENQELLGKMERVEAHRQGQWHRSIHCWVVRPVDDGYILLQKRGRDKNMYPNLLDITAAGHYSTGETRQDGVREIAEELGLHVSIEEMRFLGIKFDISQNGELKNREFCDVFLLSRKEAPAEYQLDPTEVEGLVQVRIADGLALFSGEKKSANATGVEWDKPTQTWREVNIDITPNDLIPRIDPYYLKIFICGHGLLRGEQYLSI